MSNSTLSYDIFCLRIRIEMACQREWGQAMDRHDLIRSCDLRRAFKRCAIKKMAYFVRSFRAAWRREIRSSIELAALQDQTVGVFDRERDAGEGKRLQSRGSQTFRSHASFGYFERIDTFLFPSFLKKLIQKWHSKIMARILIIIL